MAGAPPSSRQGGTGGHASSARRRGGRVAVVPQAAAGGSAAVAAGIQAAVEAALAIEAEPPAAPRPPVQHSGLAALPGELLALVARRLSQADRRSLSATCRPLRVAAWQHWATAISANLWADEDAEELSGVLARGCSPDLASLSLEGPRIGRFTLPDPNQMPALRDVVVSGLQDGQVVAFRQVEGSPFLTSLLRHTRLTRLQLANCGVNEVPSKLRRFTQLHALGLQGNAIFSLDRSLLQRMQHLSALNLSSTYLMVLPDLAALPDLRTLRLVGCHTLAHGPPPQWRQLAAQRALRRVDVELSSLLRWPHGLQEQLRRQRVQVEVWESSWDVQQRRRTALRWWWRATALPAAAMLLAALLALAVLAWSWAYTASQNVRLCLLLNPHADRAVVGQHAQLPHAQGGLMSPLCQHMVHTALKVQDRWRRLRGLPPLTGPICAVLAPIPWLSVPAVPGC